MFVNIWIESPESDNELLMVNKDCMIHNLLEYIKCKCQLDERLSMEGVVIDLADEEGNLRYLTRHHPRQNASFLLTNKATYIPIIITKNEDGTLRPFEPVPTNLKTNEEFLSQLNAQFEKKTKPNVQTTQGRKGQLGNQGKKMKERLVAVDEKEDSSSGTGGGTKGSAQRKNNLKQGTKAKR